MANKDEYLKGYNTAKSTYSKRITELKRQHNEEIAHIDICEVYPYNVLLDVADDLNTDEIRFYSPKLVEKTMVSFLTERENKILYLKYALGYTLEQCGNEFGVTRERIRQVEAKALRKMRHPKFLNECEVVPKQEYFKVVIENSKLREQVEILSKYLNNKNNTNVTAEQIIKLQNVEQTLLEEMDLSVRSFNCLKRAGANTLGDVKKLIDDNKLKEVRNLGKKSYYEICQKVGEVG